MPRVNGANHMARGQMSILSQVRKAALLHDGGGMTDGQLLECFLALREEAAFAALVRRHGPMVLGVCRRVLRNTHDAEDAFQATFLVLVRKAASLRVREVIGNWLYGVAYHTALKARAATLKRRTKEAQVMHMSRRDERVEDTCTDWQPLLDLELNRLPDKYRETVVLCDLEGKTRKEAARQLGIPEGTLSGRLTTARRRLAKCLARHGFMLPAGVLAALLSPNAMSACLPAPLVVSTVKSAALLAAGQTAAAVASANVAAITEGVLRAMLMIRLKVTAAFLIVAAFLAAGSGSLAPRSQAGATADRPVANAAQPRTTPAAVQEREQEKVRRQPRDGITLTGKLEAVDTDRNSVTVSFFSRQEGTSTDKTFPLARDAKVLRD